MAIGFGLWNYTPDRHSQPEPLRYHAAQSLDSLLLDQFKLKKVVFLGDPYEYHRTYLLTLTSFLDSWVDRIVKGPPDSSVPRHLVIALDTDPALEPVFQRFLDTGDRRALMSGIFREQSKRQLQLLFPTPPSLDFYEFLDSLRRIHLRVAALHRTTGTSATFDLIAAYRDSSTFRTTVREWNPLSLRSRVSQWRTQEKSTETAHRFHRYLQDHPESRILAFYDNQYLFRTDPSTQLSVVSLLDSLLGKNEVTMFQTSRLSRHASLSEYSGVDPRSAIEEFDLGKQGPFFIVRKEPKPAAPFPFNVVKSQNQLLAMMDLADAFFGRSDSAGVVWSKRELIQILQLLDRSELCLDARSAREIGLLLTHLSSLARYQRPLRNDLVRTRQLVNRFDGVKDIIMVDSVIGMHKSGMPTEYLSSIITVMNNLPPDSADLQFTNPSPDEQMVPTLADWGNKWRRRKVEITTYMLTQLLWIGTPKEVEGAMGALRFITKFNYRTPDEWSHWWYTMTN